MWKKILGFLVKALGEKVLMEVLEELQKEKSNGV